MYTAMERYQQPMLPEGSLSDRVILITGGGSGLGKAMGAYFSALGAKLVICGRREEKLKEAAKEISDKTGNEVLPIPCDVRKYELVETMVDQAAKHFGKVDGLVNNAAGNFVSPTERLSHRAFDAVVDIVLKGSYNCSLALGKYWIKEQIPATVLSIVTTYAWTGSAYVVPSACGKAGVLALTRSLAVEWAPHHIRLNAIAPGPFPTKGAWTRLFPPGMDKYVDPVEQVALKRAGDPQELANLAAYLMSDYSAYVTGEVITIDGGEWLYDAGQFNSMRKLPEEYWDMLEEQLKKRKG